MRETIELRIPEESARLVLNPSEGTLLGDSVRKLVLDATDERLSDIRRADQAMRRQGRAFFTSWNVRRDYRRSELKAADLLRLVITKEFEPAGEECGTVYDESRACSICGSGAEQVGPLRLDLRRLPSGADIARSIADEWVVSQRLAEALLDAGLTGFGLHPVLHSSAAAGDPLDLRVSAAGQRLLREATKTGLSLESGDFWVWVNRSAQQEALDQARVETAGASAGRAPRTSLPVWHQLRVVAPPVALSGRTAFGVDIFDNDLDGRYRCPAGHIAGLNVLSELFVPRSKRPGHDIAVTEERQGERAGLLRPAPLILASRRTYEIMSASAVKGCRWEVAHLVDG